MALKLYYTQEPQIGKYITVVIIIVWPHLYYIIDFIRNFTPLCASIFLKVVKTCFEANCKLARRDLQRKFVGNYLDLHRRSFSSLVLSHWRFKLSALASKETIMIRLDIIRLQNPLEDTKELITRQYSIYYRLITLRKSFMSNILSK